MSWIKCGMASTLICGMLTVVGEAARAEEGVGAAGPVVVSRAGVMPAQAPGVGLRWEPASASEETIAAIADRRAPTSIEEEWIAGGLRDAAVRTGAIARARLPGNQADEEAVQAACQEGPGPFLNWVFDGNSMKQGEDGWSALGPLSRDPAGYCQFQLQLLAQAKGLTDRDALELRENTQWANLGWSLESTVPKVAAERADVSL